MKEIVRNRPTKRLPRKNERALLKRLSNLRVHRLSGDRKRTLSRMVCSSRGTDLPIQTEKVKDAGADGGFSMGRRGRCREIATHVPDEASVRRAVASRGRAKRSRGRIALDPVDRRTAGCGIEGHGVGTRAGVVTEDGASITSDVPDTNSYVGVRRADVTREDYCKVQRRC